MRNGNAQKSPPRDQSFNGSPDNSQANLIGMNGNGIRPPNGIAMANGIKPIYNKVSRGQNRNGLKKINMDGLGLDSPGRSDDETNPVFNSERSGGVKGLGKSPFKTNGNDAVQQIFKKMGGAIENQFNQRMAMPGCQVKKGTVYTGEVDEHDFPVTRLDSNDYAKRLRFEELKKTRLEAMCSWKKKDVIGLKKNTYIKEIQKKNQNILTIAEKNDLEKLEVATDRFPLLLCRKAIKRVVILFTMTCESIISTDWFNNLTITIILANSLIMATEDPLTEPTGVVVYIDLFFTYFYIVECALKIFGMGLIMNENAYLRDSANLLDFFVVSFSILELFAAKSSEIGFKQEFGVRDVGGGGVDFSSLRTFRVMRPLRTISSVKGLRILMTAIISALPLLSNTIVILLFFFMMMAIAGSQLLKGELKKRCVSIQTGRIHEDDLLCSGGYPCPGGYFCGKTTGNPNYGVTNFDNLLYAFLNVFQCVTLEGWSDIMVMVWRSYSPIMCTYFVLVVLLGAFFLLNLTLAVINSAFSKAQEEQQTKDKQELQATENGAKGGNMRDEEFESAMSKKDQFSIAQFITAKIYVKKMIEFLRMRKEIKRIEEERLAKLKKKQEETIKAKRTVQMTDMSQSSMSRPNGPGSVNMMGQFKAANDNGKVNDIIPENAEEEDQPEKVDQRLKDVQNIVKQGKQFMQRQGQNTQDISVPKTLKSNGQQNGFKDLSTQKQGSNGGPTMKGIIGRTNNNQMISANDKQKKLFSKLANEYDIDKIIPKDERSKPPTSVNGGKAGGDTLISRQDSELSLGSHLKNYEMFSEKGSTAGGNLKGSVAIGSNSQKADPQDNPGEESGLITSDSDFEAAAQAAGYQHDNFSNAPAGANNSQQKKTTEMNLKKDITKTFKKMLTQNHNRTTNLSSKGNGKGDNDSTRYDGSVGNQEFDNTTQMSEIELKFQRKKNNMKNLMQNKMYKEDETLDQGYLQDQYGNKGGNEYDRMLKTKKEDIRQLEEFISTKKPKDPFKEMNALVEKVEIKKDIQYQGSSLSEIFTLRDEKRLLDFHLDKNRYLQLPDDYRDNIDPDFDASNFVKQFNLPYQKKIEYDHYLDSSDMDQSADTNEDDLAQSEQPYQTAAMVAYKPLLNQIKTEEIAKRSDIVITSTMSVSLFPKDKRIINTKYRALFSQKQRQKYVEDRAEFNSTYKETLYAQHKMREKDKVFRENYLKSFVHRQEFKTETLTKFKENTKKLNSNIKDKKPKTAEVVKQEQLKFMRNKRACEGRGQPMLDLETANRFLDGRYHDQSEEEEGDEDEMNAEEMKKKSDAEFDKMTQEFQTAALQIIRDNQDDEQEDEIPGVLRAELNLPPQMKFFNINFPEIRKQDAAKKRNRPLWSGQDVLPDNLDAAKSAFLLTHLNAIRIWPEDPHGLWKRIRFVMRLFVKGALFEFLLTSCVLLNTVVLAIEGPNTAAESKAVLDVMNLYFTWIFIVEMGLRLVSVGVGKYCAEKMNLLDGFVVLLSIFELIMEAALTAQGSSDGEIPDLSSLRALRTLRAFRVFRIARLLRMMKSMQQIISVLVKSANSFIYITILMFIWIFIFALLGMALFGGKQFFVEGPPRMNFDSFQDAIGTTFQVLTLENWQVVLFYLMRADDNNKYFVTVYLISWIFLGNFILLNLFLSVLIEAFLEGDDDDKDFKQIQWLKEQKKQRKLKKLKRQQRKKVIMAGLKEIKPSKLYLFQAMSEGEEEYEDLEDLDEEKVLKIFKNEGHMKKEKADELEVKLYINIDCKYSLYVLDKENCFREFCYKLMSNPWWERIIIILILLSSIKLAVDTYGQDLPAESEFQKTSSLIDSIFNWAFIVELLVKVLAMGLIMDNGSYLRETWNQLDFLIVSCSVLEMILNLLGAGGDLGFIKILRMLRVLRPLRMISRSPELKMVINALLESLAAIGNVLLVLCVMFLIFAIIGVNFFGGKFNYCSIDPYKLHTKSECEYAGGGWEVWDHNFDNSINGFVALFVVSSLEGWPDIFLQAVDTDAVGFGPKLGANQTGALLFFIIFILIGSFFLLNMFIGVLFLKFTEAHHEQIKGYTQEELDWKEIQELIETAEPEFATTNVPKDDRRKRVHELVTSGVFENFIMLVIVLNMIQMGVEHEGMTVQFISVIDVFSAIFTIIFIVECVLKLFAFGSTYFYTAWNKFDFFVVIASIFNYALLFLNTNAGWMSVLPQLARVFRVLRVTRILKLVGKSEGLAALMMTIQYSVGALFNVFILLILFFFIFCVLFNFMFNEVYQGEDVVDDIKNFRLFHTSFMLIFAVTTGEDWNKVMYECSRTPYTTKPCVEGINCGSYLAQPLFMLLVLCNTHIMLNLFILVIIQQFEKNYDNPDQSNLDRFTKDLAKFHQVWKEFTQARYNCKHIKESQLSDFFKRLGEFGDKQSSLGFTDDFEEQEQKRTLLRMAIRADNGFVHFNELLFRCMRRKYGSFKLNKINQIIELSTKYRLFQIIHEDKELTNEFIHDQLVKKNNNFNPFLTKMNYTITFKTWLKHAKSLQKKRMNEVRLLEAQKMGPQAYKDLSNSLADDEDKLEYVTVQIEVEIEIEYTSEEDQADSKFGIGSRGKSMANSIYRSQFGTANKSMKQGGLGTSSKKLGQSTFGKSIGGTSMKKKADHLALFQDKMKSKLMASIKKKSMKDSNLMTGAWSAAKPTKNGGMLGNTLTTPTKTPGPK